MAIKRNIRDKHTKFETALVLHALDAPHTRHSSAGLPWLPAPSHSQALRAGVRTSPFLKRPNLLNYTLQAATRRTSTPDPSREADLLASNHSPARPSRFIQSRIFLESICSRKRFLSRTPPRHDPHSRTGVYRNMWTQQASTSALCPRIACCPSGQGSVPCGPCRSE